MKMMGERNHKKTLKGKRTKRTEVGKNSKKITNEGRVRTEAEGMMVVVVSVTGEHYQHQCSSEA